LEGKVFSNTAKFPMGQKCGVNLFNPRQLLALCTFGKWVREAHRRILQATNDPDFAKAVATYLALAVDFMANRNSSPAFGTHKERILSSLRNPCTEDGLGLRRVSTF
jgi:adenine-specific DNA methylase